MNISELEDFLCRQKANFSIIKHEEAIKSKNDALKYYRIEETVPVLIIYTENEFYALIVSGERNKVDLEKIKQILGVCEIRLAKKEEIMTKLNLEIGRVPLIGHRLPCIIDKTILKHKYVYGGTGDFYHTLKIAPKDIMDLNDVVTCFD